MDKKAFDTKGSKGFFTHHITNKIICKAKREIVHDIFTFGHNEPYFDVGILVSCESYP